MVSYTTESIRNIALLGHGAAGKTTLVESILHHAGKLPAPGTVEKGNTVCDFDPQEKTHQHSLDAALVNFDYNGCAHQSDRYPRLPGFYRSSHRRVAGGGNGGGGHQRANRHRSSHSADDGARRERRQCRMIIVNKIDAENVDLAGLLAPDSGDAFRQGMPADQLARRWYARGGLLLQSGGDSDFSSVAAAHSA
jgi:elongation factor G